MSPSPVTVGRLRAELLLYADDALVEVHVADGPGSVRVLRIVDVGYGSIVPDEVVGAVLPLMAELPPPPTA